MRLLISSVILSLFLFNSYAIAGTRTVEGKTTGKCFNNLIQGWELLPIIVYVDNKGKTYVKAGDQAVAVKGVLLEKDRVDMIGLLKKSSDWVKTAKAEQIEVDKELGSFVKTTDGMKHGIALRFFSANKAKQTDVTMKIVDFENPFDSELFYLDESQVKQFITLLEKVPATLKILLDNENKANKFK